MQHCWKSQSTRQVNDASSDDYGLLLIQFLAKYSGVLDRR
jgi:hypothetical protein